MGGLNKHCLIIQDYSIVHYCVLLQWECDNDNKFIRVDCPLFDLNRIHVSTKIQGTKLCNIKRPKRCRDKGDIVTIDIGV